MIRVEMPVLKAQVIITDDESVLPRICPDLCTDGYYLCRTWYAPDKKEVLYHRVIIHMKKWTWPCLAHELVHAANMICEGMGMRGDLDNDELQAYIVQHVMEECDGKVEQLLH